MKECSVCKIRKEASTNFYLQKQRNGSMRRCSWCKECSIKLAVKNARFKRSDETRRKAREYWHSKMRPRILANKRNWDREQKLKYVQYKGGKCQLCGYDKCIASLDFHHIDPSQKDFQVTAYRKSWEIAKAELDKCVLLCANCHREVHYSQKEKDMDSWFKFDVRKLQEDLYKEEENARCEGRFERRLGDTHQSESQRPVAQETGSKTRC